MGSPIRAVFADKPGTDGTYSAVPDSGKRSVCPRFPSPNALGVSGTRTGSHATDGQGEWPDTYFVCSTACPGSTGEADAAQSWTYNGVGLPHVNGIVYKCSSVTVDGN